VTCELCGAELRIGDFPFCRGIATNHARGSFNAQGDEIDFWAENAWPEPRHFTSQSAYQRALAADGMELRPHYVPGSKHLSNWATIDPQTLENARLLVSRAAPARNEATVTLDTVSFTSRTVTDGPWAVGTGEEMRVGDL
jgi:hypothetical protein